MQLKTNIGNSRGSRDTQKIEVDKYLCHKIDKKTIKHWKTID